MRKGAQQAPKSQHPGEFQRLETAWEDRGLQTPVLRGAYLQSSCEREISQRMTKR